jgi:hypothetical protein
MTANPDALRRAADEMEAQYARIERLVADLRDRADKIHEVRRELARAGFPVDEGDWPVDQLRALIANRAGILASLEEVRNELDGLQTDYGQFDKTYDNTSKLLDDAGYYDGSVLERTARIIAERDNLRADLNAARIAIRELEDNNLDRVREVTALRKEVAALRAPKAVEWRGGALLINGVNVGNVCGVIGGMWEARGSARVCRLPNEPTARAVLLALADQPFGELAFGLRDDARVEDLAAASKAGLSSYVDSLLRVRVRGLNSGCPVTTKAPEVVSMWVAHGHRALTVEAVTP